MGVRATEETGLSLIEVKQLPVIVERLRMVKDGVEATLKDALRSGSSSGRWVSADGQPVRAGARVTQRRAADLSGGRTAQSAYHPPAAQDQGSEGARREDRMHDGLLSSFGRQAEEIRHLHAHGVATEMKSSALQRESIAMQWESNAWPRKCSE